MIFPTISVLVSCGQDRDRLERFRSAPGPSAAYRAAQSARPEAAVHAAWVVVLRRRPAVGGGRRRPYSRGGCGGGGFATTAASGRGPGGARVPRGGAEAGLSTGEWLGQWLVGFKRREVD
jgi:hypothetical protein